MPGRISSVTEQNRGRTVFWFKSIGYALMDVKAIFSTLKSIVSSNERDGVLIGKTLTNISKIDPEIILEDNTKEIIKI